MKTRLSPSQEENRVLQFSAHVYCAQTAGWIKMPLGMEVGLGSGHIVLWGPSSRSPKMGHAPRNLWPMFVDWLNSWIDQDILIHPAVYPRGRMVDLGPGNIVLDADSIPQGA